MFVSRCDPAMVLGLGGQEFMRGVWVEFMFVRVCEGGNKYGVRGLRGEEYIRRFQTGGYV